MMPGHIVLTVAKYEAKTLLRSWFFRVFAFLTLGILILLDTVLFATPFSQWMHRGMSASVPYTNIILLNIAQAVIAVFMASEFLKFDRKLDTAESVYSRSMTNTGYVVGKMLGILGVFVGLNITVLLVSFVFQFFFTEVRVVPALYLYYPLLLSFPTLIFMFGLSFLVMALIRNQAITFLLLLGYVVSVIMFLGERLSGLADVIGLHVPLMYSDFVGFGASGPVLMQRGMYLFLGIACILATAILLPRLIQSRTVRAVTVALTAFFIASGGVLGTMYLKDFSDGRALRAKMWTLNQEAVKKPAVTLTACDLAVTHSGDAIDTEAKLSFTNATAEPLDSWIFSLNPGFTVGKITRNGAEVPFERNIHLITVKAPEPLLPGASDTITITYRGTIDEDACYSDLGESERSDVLRYWVYAVDRRYGFITPDYVLLTAEDMWYPVAGIPYGAAFPDLGKRDFVQFSLAVKTAKGLTAISQGTAGDGTDGVTFVPEHPLPQISLVIGKYEKKSVTAEGVEYSIYYRPGHDYFSKYFNLIGDTIGSTIDEALFDYETSISLSYSFPRLSLVETPLQFSSYARLWKAGDETSQPEQILIPEKGVLFRAADFKLSSYFMKQRQQRGGSQTPEEIQTSYLTSFINRTFISSTSSMSRNMQRSVITMSRSGGPGGGNRSGRNRAGSGGGANRLMRMAFMFGGLNVETNYTLFPQFYAFTNHISDATCPLLDPAIESYLMSRSEGSSFSFRFFQGMTVEEEANALLAKMSLAEILRDPAATDLAADALKNKAAFLFTMLRNSAGTETFDTFLSDYLYANNYRDTGSDALAAAMRDKFAIDLPPILSSWYTGKDVPAYLLGDVVCHEVTVGDHSRYNVLFTITNTSKSDGVVTASFIVESSQSGSRNGRMTGGGGGMGMMMMQSSSPENTKILSLKSGETKQIGMVFDTVPRRMTVNTHVSLNLPAAMSRSFGTPEKGGEMFEGERVLPNPPRTIEPGEVVVDDESAGFRAISGKKNLFLMRLLKRDGESAQTYAAFQFRNAPASWQATILDGFYGSYRHSARYIRAGEGEKRAIWTADLPGNGQYDVYCYCPSFQMTPGFGRGGGQRQQGGEQQRQQSTVEDFHFIVHHDDGTEEVEVDLKNHDEGWVLIGTYYFSAGKAEVELTDKSRGRVVFADAVKWAKRQNSSRAGNTTEKRDEQ